MSGISIRRQRLRRQKSESEPGPAIDSSISGRTHAAESRGAIANNGTDRLEDRTFGKFAHGFYGIQSGNIIG